MSLHHSQTLIGTEVMLVLTLARLASRVLSVAANLLDFREQALT
jgi:hypothetical protein